MFSTNNSNIVPLSLAIPNHLLRQVGAVGQKDETAEKKIVFSGWKNYLSLL
jgi:hypothetical protein